MDIEEDNNIIENSENYFQRYKQDKEITIDGIYHIEELKAVIFLLENDTNEIYKL